MPAYYSTDFEVIRIENGALVAQAIGSRADATFDLVFGEQIVMARDAGFTYRIDEPDLLALQLAYPAEDDVDPLEPDYL